MFNPFKNTIKSKHYKLKHLNSGILCSAVREECERQCISPKLKLPSFKWNRTVSTSILKDLKQTRALALVFQHKTTNLFVNQNVFDSSLKQAKDS